VNTGEHTDEFGGMVGIRRQGVWDDRQGCHAVAKASKIKSSLYKDGEKRNIEIRIVCGVVEVCGEVQRMTSLLSTGLLTLHRILRCLRRSALQGLEYIYR
jgi:hypothetical protein